MTHWYVLIDATPHDGPTNMARDAHLMELLEAGALQVPILRIYFWNPPCLSLGFHQPWRQVVDPRALAAEKIDLVRRPTGGRAVLHQDELTYSVIAPTKKPFSSVIAHNYRLIGEALHRFTNASESASILVTEAEKESAQQRTHPCFASISKSEIASGEKKLVGSAQKISKRCFLQHGSIPLINHVDRLRRITGSKLPLEHMMTCLEDAWQARGLSLPDTQELTTRLIEAFSHAFHVAWMPLEKTGYPDENRVKSLVEQTFGNHEWTYRR